MNFATVHLGCSPNNVSFGAFNHSKGPLGKLTMFVFWKSLGQMAVVSERFFTFVSQSPAVVWAAVYICLPVFLGGVAQLVFSYVLQLFPTFGSQCLRFSVLQCFDVLWSIRHFIPNALRKVSPTVVYIRLPIFPQTPFTLVSQFLQFSGAFGAGFGRGL